MFWSEICQIFSIQNRLNKILYQLGVFGLLCSWLIAHHSMQKLYFRGSRNLNKLHSVMHEQTCLKIALLDISR